MSETSEKKESTGAGSQKFYLAACFLCMCATIAVAAYSLTQRTERQPRRLWSPMIVETNGNQGTIQGESRQMEFWTPSADTKDYLRKEGGDFIGTEKWQVFSNDDAALQFGLTLHTNRSVLGYRRVKVWGHGRTDFKPGWWWTLDVLTNYTVGDLARSYEDFWKSHRMVYVEVIDNRGRVE